MKKQMELFEDGGLADEGGTVDPVSGNDVPSGSTQEEVRDDIPAQLSEGEFVLPADVVRYHGLEKIMQLRDEAKRGLQKMEDMGQMGNAEEAVLDDDVPFSIDDLDMEDDGVLEYNQGGIVPAQGFTGIQQSVPSAYTNYQPQYVPYQVPQAPTAYTPPQQQAVPMQQAPQELPTFQQFVQPPEGTSPENREYVNPETGERRMFTFIGGQPTVEIPAGFIPASQYTGPEATPTSATVGTVGTATVAGDSSREDRESEQARIEEERFGPGAGRLGIGGDIYGISFDDVGFMDSRGMLMSMAITGRIPEDMEDTVTVNIKRDDTSFSITGKQFNQLKESIEKTGANSDETKNTFNLLQAEAQQREKEEVMEQAREEGSEAYKERAGAAAEAQRQAELAKREAAIAAEQQRAREAAAERARQDAAMAEAERRQAAEDRAAERAARSSADVQRAVQSFTERTGISRAYGGRAKGGYIDKQMEKSGLTPKK